MDVRVRGERARTRTSRRPRATSAAPTYFWAEQLASQPATAMVDGGVFADNTASCPGALFEVLDRLRCPASMDHTSPKQVQALQQEAAKLIATSNERLDSLCELLTVGAPAPGQPR